MVPQWLLIRRRVLHLNACARGSLWASVESVHFLIDELPEEVRLPTDRGGPGDVVPEYSGIFGCGAG